MKEKLQNVLNKIMIKKYPQISNIEIEQKHFAFFDGAHLGNMYVVTYYIDGGLTNKEGYNISEETKSLFNMMGLPKSDTLLVDYENA